MAGEYTGIVCRLAGDRLRHDNFPMRDPADRQQALCELALSREAAGNFESAVRHYRQAVQIDPANPTPYLFLGHALLRTGDAERAAQCWSLGADLDSRLVTAWRNPDVAADLRERSQAADRTIRQRFAALHRAAMDRVRGERPGASIERIDAAIWCLTHQEDFDYRDERQRPHVFYVPDLPPVPVFVDLPWRAELEAAAEAIRDEYLAVAARAASAARPYLDARNRQLDGRWEALKGTLNWTSWHLYKAGTPDDAVLPHCPVTSALLDRLPVLRTGPHPREALFSVLRGGQHIPPHYGLANTDATVHLPLITTPDSGIRVARKHYDWQAGRLFAFDDSFEHESWNDGAEPRVNLLFEAWHPDLSDDERAAVAATFDLRERWNRQRRA